MGDSADEIARDIAAISRIDAVPSLLRVVCDITGMGFGVVARVTDSTWTACAVLDRIAFGLRPGGQLELHTTLCREVREAREPIVIDHASEDSRYCDHVTTRHYGIESYISVPIVLPGGEYFGNLCAIDPKPAQLSKPRIVEMFQLYAELIALQLANDRASEAQRSALIDAQQNGDLRDQFIAVLGHDLRNPLNVVMNAAQLLDARPQDQETAVIARRIVRSATRMSALIDDVLDFARGQLGGGFAVRVDEVHDIAAALQDVADETRAANPGTHINVSIEAPEHVRCDRVRIQQLASNLLANAVQHGAAGAPIDFSAKVSEGCVVITVSNAGEPIPPDSLAKVFQPFWRRNTSQRREGLGLGLFICSEIAKAHGGQIEVLSTPEHGTTFAARLPIGTTPPGP